MVTKSLIAGEATWCSGETMLILTPCVYLVKLLNVSGPDSSSIKPTEGCEDLM